MADDRTSPVPTPDPTPDPAPPPDAEPASAAPSTSPAEASPDTAPLVDWQAPAEPTGPAPGVRYAPHGPRIVAYILDGVIITVVFLLLLVPIGLIAAGQDRDGPSGAAVAALIVLGLAAIAVSVLYFPFFWQRTGQTPGMRPFHLWVVRDRDGASFGWGTALLRLLGLYVAGSVFYLGFIWIFVDKRRRGWQDLIAGTIVIERVQGPGEEG